MFVGGGGVLIILTESQAKLQATQLNLITEYSYGERIS